MCLLVPELAGMNTRHKITYLNAEAKLRTVWKISFKHRKCGDFIPNKNQAISQKISG